jgi:cytochrome c oxidase subunit II
MPRRANLVIAGAAFAVAFLAIAGVLIVGNTRHADSPVSRGEAIFQAGVDANGVAIPRTVTQGGGGMMGGGMMGGGMMGGGCASCHGAGGQGRTTPFFEAPNISYSNLTDPQGMLMPDGKRGPVYTDVGIRTAVTQGIDPEGSHLEWPMPQWQLGTGEWGDLLAYLKTLR